MVQQHVEVVTGDVVAAAGEQDRARDLAVPQHLLERARELRELPVAVRHVFDAIARARDVVNLEAMLVLEFFEDVGPRIVEPRITLGDDDAGAGRG